MWSGSGWGGVRGSSFVWIFDQSLHSTAKVFGLGQARASLQRSGGERSRLRPEEVSLYLFYYLVSFSSGLQKSWRPQ